MRDGLTTSSHQTVYNGNNSALKPSSALISRLTARERASSCRGSEHLRKDRPRVKDQQKTGVGLAAYGGWRQQMDVKWSLCVKTTLMLNSWPAPVLLQTRCSLDPEAQRLSRAFTHWASSNTVSASQYMTCSESLQQLYFTLIFSTNRQHQIMTEIYYCCKT